MNKANQAGIFIIKFYRNYLSYLKLPSCRYYPSCSEYAISCLKKYHFFKAALCIVWRILRCNPFSKGGFDFVR